MPVRRHTFLVQIREPDWGTVVEETRTGRRAAVDDLGEIGTQIATWLEAPDEGDRPPRAADAPGPERPGAAMPIARRPARRPGPADG